MKPGNNAPTKIALINPPTLDSFLRFEGQSIATWRLIAFVFVSGLFGIRLTLLTLWEIWTTDPLQSIGFLLPPIALVLICKLWRQLRPKFAGSWWGLLPLASAYLISLFHQDMLLYWSVSGRTAIAILPLALPLALYVSGIVLLFGGKRMFQASLFPLFLLLMAKPIPKFFTAFFDLPLQHITAHVARSFATAIGFAPKTPELTLMFSPDFGMFIAPGCDGIRGASTMAYLALIVGHFKRLRILPWIGYVVSGALLGYVFNFTRICLLVIYYRFAIGHHRLENCAKEADYVIGFLLFVLAAVFFAGLVLRRRRSEAVSDALISEASPLPFRSLGFMATTALVVLVLACFGYAYTSRAERAAGSSKTMQGERMPQQVGDYVLTNTWYEHDMGITTNEDGIYVSSATHQQVTLIVWIGHSVHNVNDSWYTRGVTPTTRVTKNFVASSGEVAFDTGLYLEGDGDTLLANAMCTPSNCSKAMQPNSHLDLIFTAPDLGDIAKGEGRVVPVAVKVEQPHSSEPDAAISAQLNREMQDYLVALNPQEISRRFQ